MERVKYKTLIRKLMENRQKDLDRKNSKKKFNKRVLMREKKLNRQKNN
jgi:hypothetical protein